MHKLTRSEYEQNQTNAFYQALAEITKSDIARQSKADEPAERSDSHNHLISSFADVLDQQPSK